MHMARRWGQKVAPKAESVPKPTVAPTSGAVASSLQTFEISTSDPLEALEISSSLFFPHRYTTIGTGAPFSFGLNVATFEGLTVGLVALGGEIALKNDQLGAYHIRAPLRGRLLSTTLRGQIVAAPGHAAVYRPDDSTALACLDPETLIWLIKLDAATLERYLTELLGEPAPYVVDLAPTLDVTSPEGAAFWALTEPLRNRVALAALASNSLVAKPYVEMVASALLHCVEHRHSERLRTPPQRASRPIVASAVEQIRAAPQHAWTVAALAAGSFCSVRSLQAGFVHDLGTTPMRYLASVRMAGAHGDLARADPFLSSVSGIATDWGFSHLGRFSAAHRRSFGESPSQTLHRLR
jgi:AraC-like DNA-binding protein